MAASTDTGVGLASPRVCGGLAELSEEFDALLLDQWGVLHDGQQAYDGAVQAVRDLHAAGKRLLLLSNTGRRGSDNLFLLERMGFDPACLEGVLSAGDDARDALVQGDTAFHRSLGRHCRVLSRPADRVLAEGLGYALIDDIEQADWLFLLSIEPPACALDAWRALLHRAVERGLPMICGNPDQDRPGPAGRLFEAAGRTATYYASLGGSVQWHGKPEPRIYRSGLDRLGCVPGRVLAVGDSMSHDILGARRAGLRCVLITRGVHAAELGVLDDSSPDAARCRALFERCGLAPDWVLPALRW